MGSRPTWRSELLARIPWIKRRAEMGKCDQYRWSSMSIKVAYDLDLRETYRCRNGAYWEFIGLDRLGVGDALDFMLVGKSGVYCYSHLINQAFIPDNEFKRYRAWCDQHKDLVERIKNGTEPKMLKERTRRAPHDISDEA